MSSSQSAQQPPGPSQPAAASPSPSSPPPAARVRELQAAQVAPHPLGERVGDERVVEAVVVQPAVNNRRSSDPPGYPGGVVVGSPLPGDGARMSTPMQNLKMRQQRQRPAGRQRSDSQPQPRNPPPPAVQPEPEGLWKQGESLLTGIGSVFKKAATSVVNVLAEPDEDEYKALYGPFASKEGRIVPGKAREGFVRYQCGSHDTYASIALKFHMRLTHLTYVNNITSPHPAVGEVLLVRRPDWAGSPSPGTAMQPGERADGVLDRLQSSIAGASQHAWSGEVLRVSACYHKEAHVQINGQMTLSSSLLAFDPSPSHPLVVQHSSKPYRLHLSIAMFQKSVLDDENRLRITYRTSPPGAKGPPELVTCVFSMVGEDGEEDLMRIHTRIHVLMMLYGQGQDSVQDASHPMQQFPSGKAHRHSDSGGFVPILDTQSQLLSLAQIQALNKELPLSHRFENWFLLYSLYHHGVSLGTFFRHTAEMGPSLIVVKDENGYVFGGFASESWRQSSKYYGTGESFVFQLEPNFTVYRWSSANEYFLISTKESVSMGGGGNYAFSLDSDFLQGSSGDCATFGSPCLASQREFRCVSLEVWGFNKPSFGMSGASCV